MDKKNKLLERWFFFWRKYHWKKIEQKNVEEKKKSAKIFKTLAFGSLKKSFEIHTIDFDGLSKISLKASTPLALKFNLKPYSI